MGKEKEKNRRKKENLKKPKMYYKITWLFIFFFNGNLYSSSKEVEQKAQVSTYYCKSKGRAELLPEEVLSASSSSFVVSFSVYLSLYFEYFEACSTTPTVQQFSKKFSQKYVQ